MQAVVPGTGGGTTTFKYDPFGRRIQKSGPLGTTNYLYDGLASIEDTDASGNIVGKYTQGGGIDHPLAGFMTTGSIRRVFPAETYTGEVTHATRKRPQSYVKIRISWTRSRIFSEHSRGATGHRFRNNSLNTCQAVMGCLRTKHSWLFLLPPQSSRSRRVNDRLIRSSDTAVGSVYRACIPPASLLWQS